jgi:hypothetical protein
MGFLYAEDQDKKDKDRNIMFPVFEEVYKGKIKFSVTIDIGGFNAFLNEISSNPIIQMLWNDVKERFGKDVDEKELYKVFEFYVLIINFLESLEDAKKAVSSKSIGSWGYYLYNDKNLFDGKLDEATFRDLLMKINKYDLEEFSKKYQQNKERKGEQPK